MTENRVVALRQKGAIDDPLTEILRTGARRLIAQAVEAEFETFLASTAELVLPDGRRRVVRHGHDPVRAIQMPIPTKPPVYNGMIAPRDSWMMQPPCNEMIPPGAPRLLAERVSSPCGVAGQAVLDCLPRARRRLSPVSSMRCALCTRRSRMASA